MPKRPMLRAVLAGEDIDTAGLVDEIENLRQGTRDQYESAWTSILGDAPDSPGTPLAQVISFDHKLGEIPVSVDVMSSKEPDGKYAIDDNASVTVTKTATKITVTNTSGVNLYFKVRAM